MDIKADVVGTKVPENPIFKKLLTCGQEYPLQNSSIEPWRESKKKRPSQFSLRRPWCMNC